MPRGAVELVSYPWVIVQAARRSSVTGKRVTVTPPVVCSVQNGVT